MPVAEFRLDFPWDVHSSPVRHSGAIQVSTKARPSGRTVKKVCLSVPGDTVGPVLRSPSKSPGSGN